MEEQIVEIQQRFGIVGRNEKFLQAVNTAMQVASTNLSVLILGESGSGKDVFPQIIHSYSSRRNKPYIPVNCGAIPEGTIESELFGHEKGSFTGASMERKGYFEEADGGTIFLDEIGELPLMVQVKLLRVLEKGEYLRVGSSVVRKTDVRIVAATNLNLYDAIHSNRFRADLFYRLNGIMISVPPLRERKEDIAVLFRKFVSNFAMKNRIPAVMLTDSAVSVLQRYNWPGNVRQLKNIAEMVTTLSETRNVTGMQMERFMPNDSSAYPAMVDKLSVLNNMSANERDIIFKAILELRHDVDNIKRTLAEFIKGDVHSEDVPKLVQQLALEYRTEKPEEREEETPEVETLDKTIVTDDYMSQPLSSFQVEDEDTIYDNEDDVEIDDTLSIAKTERALIMKALNKYRGRRKLAAKALGISERTLFRKIDEYNIED